MKYVAYKLSFQTGVHLGNGILNETEETFRADTLFSALCIEAVKRDCLNTLYQLVRKEKIIFSDAFPFMKDCLYIPKPIMKIEREEDASNRKLWKKLKYIPINGLREYCSGKLDAEVEISKLKNLGSKKIQQKVCLSGLEKTDLYSVGVYYFQKGNGLYFLMGYKKEEDKYFIEELLDSLGYQGIGGKVSSGLGKFSMLPVTIENGISERLNREKGEFLLLTTSLPQEDELKSVLLNAHYLLEKRGGFVQSVNYSGEMQKKKEMYFLKAGATVYTRFTGDVYDVGISGTHSVWRYARPVLLEVSD